MIILNTPPESPKSRDIYLIGDEPTNEWVGFTNHIAEWDKNNGMWRFSKNKTEIVVESGDNLQQTNIAWIKKEKNKPKSKKYKPTLPKCNNCANWQQIPQLIDCQVGICWIAYHPNARNLKLTKKNHYCTKYKPNQ